MVAIIGTTDVIFRKIQKMFSKEEKDRLDINRKPPNDMSSEEAKETKTLYYEQDVLSTWL